VKRGPKGPPPSVADAARPKVWPRWKDAELVGEVAKHIAAGHSIDLVSTFCGLSRAAVGMWIAEYHASLDAIDEATAKGDEPKALDLERVTALAPVARARAAYLMSLEELAQASDPFAMWALPRIAAKDWGTAQAAAVQVNVNSGGGFLERLSERLSGQVLDVEAEE
jgi:transposase